MPNDQYWVGFPACMGAAVYGPWGCTCMAPVRVPCGRYPGATSLVDGAKRRCVVEVPKQKYDEWIRKNGGVR